MIFEDVLNCMKLILYILYLRCNTERNNKSPYSCKKNQTTSKTRQVSHGSPSVYGITPH